MKENPQDVLTVEVFNKFIELFEERLEKKIDEKIDRLDQKMMAGFEVVFNRFEKLENKIDTMMLIKADTESLLLLNKRVAKLEEKVA